MEASDFEFNFDGLVGPTHNYAGLSHGNLASSQNKALESNPREAALQGLEKMRQLAAMGFKQGVLPPLERPDMQVFRRLGFQGGDAQILKSVGRVSPELLVAGSSASSMWTANAATIAPRADTLDAKTHFTPANLINKFHRSIEPPGTQAALRAIFHDPRYFAHHSPLHASEGHFGDEGAANHTRFCKTYGGPGVHFFVFGRSAFQPSVYPGPRVFPGRQTLEASQAVARLHGLSDDSVVFAQQNPDAIDAGAFHNDVVSVGNLNVLFYHEAAFVESDRVLSELTIKLEKRSGTTLIPVRVGLDQVTLAEAVKSYLFNSQLLALPSGGMLLVAPKECQDSEQVSKYLRELIDSGTSPIREVRHFDLRQSMRNGGGPACLRLRVVLGEEAWKSCKPRVGMDDSLHATLSSWVEKHYRDRLRPDDLQDPQLLEESRSALDELTQILRLGSIYPFQISQK